MAVSFVPVSVGAAVGVVAASVVVVAAEKASASGSVGAYLYSFGAYLYGPFADVSPVTRQASTWEILSFPTRYCAVGD